MTTLKTDCRKFAPNIFNKTKCQNCFRTKDAHSAEALESNRATRKVSKCGYLFVAPDWDFSVYINRTKRWQRRWFVLYDDGELTYSVDEHPDTVPQAVIDMNKVLEVSDAEDLTGNQFAIAITAPDKVHFIKGTSREESKWWFDVLSRFPKSMVRGKRQRNATFPGGKSTSVPVKEEIPQPGNLPTDVSTPLSRPRFLSCEVVGKRKDNMTWHHLDKADADVFPTRDSDVYLSEPPNNRTSTPIENGSTGCAMTIMPASVNSAAKNKLEEDNKSITLNSTSGNNTVATTTTTNSANRTGHHAVVSVDGYVPVKNNSDSVISNSTKENYKKETDEDSCESSIRPLKIEDIPEMKTRSRRYLKRESRGLKSQRSRSDGVAKMIPSLLVRDPDISSDWDSLSPDGHFSKQGKNYHHNPVYLLLSDAPKVKHYESLDSLHLDDRSPLLHRKRHTSEKDNIVRRLYYADNGRECRSGKSCLQRSGSMINISSDPVEWRNRANCLRSNSTPYSTPSVKGNQSLLECGSKWVTPPPGVHPVRDETDSQERGDPDGCNLDSFSSFSGQNAEIHMELSPEDLFVKKGWLMRLGANKEWFKHWFVLRNSSLTYYRDPSAEDSGILDGVLDLGLIKGVEEKEYDRNYAFCITMWDEKKYVLSAVTAGIRNNWMQAIRHAASLRNASMKDTPVRDKQEQGNRSVNQPVKEPAVGAEQEPSPVTACPELEKTADVSSSDDHSEYFSIVDEEEALERASSPRALPPSPPLNRTAISRVKERARSRSTSRSRVNKCLKSPSANDIDQSMVSCESESRGEEGFVTPLSPAPSVNSPESQLWERQGSFKKQSGRMVQEHSNPQTPVLSRKEKGSDDKSKKREERRKSVEDRCKALDDLLKHREKGSSDKCSPEDVRHIKGSYRDLVEKYNNLKKKLEERSKKMSHVDDTYKLKYESLKNKYRREKAEWEEKVNKDRALTLALESQKDNILEDLQSTLLKSKEQLSELKMKLEKSPKKSGSLAMWKDICKLCDEVEKIMANGERKSKKDMEVIKLKNNIAELQQICDNREIELEQCHKDLQVLKTAIQKKEEEVQDISQDLQKAKDENVTLLNRVVHLETTLRTSLSKIEQGKGIINEIKEEVDLDMANENAQLRKKLSRSHDDMRALKKELRQAYENSDKLEIQCLELKQHLKEMMDTHRSEMALMTARVEDLTSKLSTSEKNSRQLKQKLTKVEAKQERRKSSLKGKEMTTLSKEFEAKLTELEKKVGCIEGSMQVSSDSPGESNECGKASTPAAEPNMEQQVQSPKQTRKKVHDAAGGESQSMLLRLYNLDSKVKELSNQVEKNGTSNDLQIAVSAERIEKPKICLQVKSVEEGCGQDEGTEDWTSLSIATSMTDLQTIDGECTEEESPQSLSECLESLTQRVDAMLAWFRNALRFSQRQDQNLDEDTTSPNMEVQELPKLADVVDYLTSEKMMEVTVSLVSEKDRRTLLGLVYNLLLVLEMAKAVHRLADLNSIKKETLKHHLAKTSHMLSTFEFCLRNTSNKCVFRDFLQQGLLNGIDLVPQPLQFTDDSSSFQTSASSFPEKWSDGDAQNSIHEVVSELSTVEDLCGRVAEHMQMFKESRIQLIVQKLAEWLQKDPHQSHTSGSSSSADRSLIPDGQQVVAQELLLTEVTQIISFIVQNALSYVSEGNYWQESLLDRDLNVLDSVRTSFVTTLQGEMASFISQLRDRCHQVLKLEQSWIAKCGDCLDPDISKIVADTAKIMVTNAVLQSFVMYYKSEIESLARNQNEPKKLQGGGDQDWVPSKDIEFWINSLQEMLWRQAELHVCGPLSAFLSLLMKCENMENKYAEMTDPLSREHYASLRSKIVWELQAERQNFEQQLNKLEKALESLREEQESCHRDCNTCCELREEVERLKNALEHCERAARDGVLCEKCEELHARIQRIVDQHQEELNCMANRYQREREALKMQLQEVVEQKNVSHQEEVENLKSELQSSQNLIKKLQVEYDEHIQNLRETYEQRLLHCHGIVNEEVIRQRYQTEIEQLKNLCEKGLAAMENCHQRILSEMERKHKEELDQLETEKKKALAEETQATLAALDAMRRAHEQELQNEISRFKDEFLQKMHSDLRTETMQQEHRADLNEIKEEILSLSEKYSIKCLENVSLEERLQAMNKQLQEANYQVFDLLARNKQLRAHLASDIIHTKEALHNQDDMESIEHMKQLIGIREKELAEQKEENAQLRQELHLAQVHLERLDLQCQQLDQSLKAERRLREDGVSSLTSLLESVVANASVGEKKVLRGNSHETAAATAPSFLSSSSSSTPSTVDSRPTSALLRVLSGNTTGSRVAAEQKPKSDEKKETSRARELVRSPSCPGLDGHSGGNIWPTTSPDTLHSIRMRETARE